MERLEDCLSFLIGKAAQEVTRRSRKALAPYKVTPTQFAVLKVLWDGEGLSGAEIGSRLVLDSATITGLLDRTESAGLIERRADPEGDRRINRVFLTKAGRDLRAPLESAMDAVNAAFADELGPDEARRLWRALGRVGKVGAP